MRSGVIASVLGAKSRYYKSWPLIFSLVLLSSCSSKPLIEHPGPITNNDMGQLEEQCAAQPNLSWCKPNP